MAEGPITTLAQLFDELQLSHVAASFEEETLEAFEARCKSDRSKFLQHLKDAGIDKLPERQKIANGLARARREGRLPPPALPPPPPQAPLPPPVILQAKAPMVRRRVLCLHGGTSSGDIMAVQVGGLIRGLREEYEFVFAQGPAWRELDPSSVEAKTLAQFFEGLPVLEWMSLLDRRTNAPIVVPSLKDESPTGAMSAAERREHREATARRQQEQAVAAGSAALPMSGSTHYYAYYERAIRTLAETVQRDGPFEGFIGFSQVRARASRNRRYSRVAEA